MHITSATGVVLLVFRAVVMFINLILMSLNEELISFRTCTIKLSRAVGEICTREGHYILCTLYFLY